jgi:hypothetical protein
MVYINLVLCGGLAFYFGICSIFLYRDGCDQLEFINPTEFKYEDLNSERAF